MGVLGLGAGVVLTVVVVVVDVVGGNSVLGGTGEVEGLGVGGPTGTGISGVLIRLEEELQANSSGFSW